MTEREPRFHVHTIDRAVQEGSIRFNREYHLHVAGVGHFSAQILFPHGRFALGVEGDLINRENLVGVQACVPPVGIHLGFESWKAAREIRAILRALGAPTSAFTGRETSIGIFDWAVWWKIFGKPFEWSTGTPRWRDGSWHPFGYPGERIGAEEILGEREDVIQLPEGPQACTLRLGRGRYRSTRFPLLLVMRYFVDFDFAPAVDTGSRKGATWSMSVEADSFEDGIYKMRMRILTERARNNWEAPASAKGAA